MFNPEVDEGFVTWGITKGFGAGVAGVVGCINPGIQSSSVSSDPSAQSLTCEQDKWKLFH